MIRAMTGARTESTPSVSSTVSPTAARRAVVCLLGACWLLVLSGCPDSWSRKKRSPASAVWIGSGSDRLEPSVAALLQSAGIEEAFVEVASFDAEASPPVRKLDAASAEVPLPVHLVVTGSTRLPADDDRLSDLASATVDAIRQLRFDAESRGWLVLGVCFDLDGPSAGDLAGFLERIQGDTDELFLSATLPREQVEEGSDGLAAVAGAVDFLVPMLYGQKPGQADVKAAWSFGDVEQRIEILESLGVPYQLGVITLGTASYADSKGSVKAQTSRISMQEVMADRAMRMQPGGFTLEGTDRRIYVLRADQPAQVGPWRLSEGDMVRVVRAATYDLEELHRLLALWPTKHHLGQVYYRIPGPAEGLSLPVESLAGSLDDRPATPKLVLDASVQRRVGGGWLVRFAIENQNREFTELSFTQYNYLDVRTATGSFASEQKAGDFYSYDLFRDDGSGEPRRTIRNPDLLRLQVPVLEADQRVSTGDIRLQARSLDLTLQGRFLLPDGRVVELGPAYLREGGLSGKDIEVRRSTDGAAASEPAEDDT